ILLELANCMSDKTQPLSDDICTGLQIANFCQDMSRDAAIGRIYAPEELWSGHGVTESMILKRQPTDELKSMLREWVQETHQYFHRGKQLIALVPKWLATDVELFLRGGQSILQEIERQDYDVWTRRPEISKWKKLKLLLGIWCWPR
ncbi:MAG: squalene/phytoene synthase family protein, partial [Planctomycetota bacterium]